MAIANSLCIRLLLCAYKSNTVCERALLRTQQEVSPPNIGSGKEESHDKCPKLLVSVTFLVCVGCRESGGDRDFYRIVDN